MYNTSYLDTNWKQFFSIEKKNDLIVELIFINNGEDFVCLSSVHEQGFRRKATKFGRHIYLTPGKVLM